MKRRRRMKTRRCARVCLDCAAVIAVAGRGGGRGRGRGSQFWRCSVFFRLTLRACRPVPVGRRGRNKVWLVISGCYRRITHVPLSGGGGPKPPPFAMPGAGGAGKQEECKQQ